MRPISRVVGRLIGAFTWSDAVSFRHLAGAAARMAQSQCIVIADNDTDIPCETRGLHPIDDRSVLQGEVEGRYGEPSSGFRACSVDVR